MISILSLRFTSDIDHVEAIRDHLRVRKVQLPLALEVELFSLSNALSNNETLYKYTIQLMAETRDGMPQEMVFQCDVGFHGFVRYGYSVNKPGVYMGTFIPVIGARHTEFSFVIRDPNPAKIYSELSSWTNYFNYRLFEGEDDDIISINAYDEIAKQVQELKEIHKTVNELLHRDDTSDDISLLSNEYNDLKFKLEAAFEKMRMRID